MTPAHTASDRLYPTARTALALLLLTVTLTLGACGKDPSTATEPSALADAAADEILAGFGDGPDGMDEGDGTIDVGEYDGAAAPFDIVLARMPIELVMRFTKRVQAGTEVPMTVRAAYPQASEPVRGTLTIDYGDGAVETADLFRKADLRHTFESQGVYRMRVLLEDGEGNRVRAGFRIRVSPPITVDMAARPDGALRPGTPQVIRFIAVTDDGNNTFVPGRLTVDYGDGSTQVFPDFTGDRREEHTYAEEGQYVITMTLVATVGGTFEQSFPLDVLINNTNDEIDLSTVSFVHYNVSGWEVTSETLDITVTGSEICVPHTKSGDWPVSDGAEGNPWVVMNIDGQWYAGTYEWLRPGQVCKNVTMEDISGHVKQPPFLQGNGWVIPRPGDVLYFFVSTPARFGPETVPERSNAKRWVCC